MLQSLDPINLGKAVGAAWATAQGGRAIPSSDTLKLEQLMQDALQAKRALAQQVSGDELRAVISTAHVAVMSRASEASESEEDPFWKNQRERIGLVEDHANALYLVITLSHVDKVMENDHRDFLPREEVEAALGTLVGQPLDIAMEMDRHERERISWWNGIRGFIYGARLNGDAIEIGAMIWAIDFPQLTTKVIQLRDSLGASFDLLARSFDLRDYGSARPVRVLKQLTFMGGTVLIRRLAADKSSDVKHLRYAGKSIEELEEEQRMKQAGNDDAGGQAQSQAAAAVNGNVTGVPVLNPASGETALVSALAESQSKVSSLNLELERLTQTVANKDEELRLIGEEVKALRSRAEAAEQELGLLKSAKEAEDRVEQRLQALASKESELRGKNLNVTLFTDEEAKTRAIAEFKDLSDEQFEVYVLKAENRMLASARLAEPGSGGATEPVQSQASGATPRPGAFSSLNAGSAYGGESLAELGLEIAAKLRG